MNIREKLISAGHYLAGRFLEPSTWRGLILVVSAGGWAALDGSSKGEVIMQCGLLLAGLVQVLLPQSMLYRPSGKP